MATSDIEPIGPRRRASLRRARSGGGFGAVASTHSESLRDEDNEQDYDEVDAAVEPNSMNAAVRQRALAPIGTDLDDGGGNTPRARLHQISMAGSSAYAKEARLTLMNRMLMRGVGLDIIARELQISISTAEKYRAELKGRLREDARQLNIDEMVGSQLATYEELSQMAMRIASSGGENSTPTAMRLAAMRTALAANADKNRFLNTAGVYDVLRFKRAEDAGELSDVQKLMAQTMAMLDGLNEPEDPPEPQPPRRERVIRGGGFKAMTFDDNEASSGDAETVDI